MTKLDAFLNAQAVFQYALSFYTEEIVACTSNGTTINVSIHLPWDKYDSMKEKNRFAHVILADAHVAVLSHCADYYDVLDITFWPRENEHSL